MSEENKKLGDGGQEALHSIVPTIVIGACNASDLQVETARRAWNKYLPAATVLVVGKDIPMEVDGKNPVADYTDMVVAAVASDLVPEMFVFVPVETFPVSPIRMADLEVLKAWDASSREKEVKVIAKVMKRKEGLANYYPNILPIVLSKARVTEVIEKYKLDKNLVSFSTVYLTHFHPAAVAFAADVKSSVLAVITRSNPDMAAVAEILPKRMFFHCNVDGLGAIAGLLAERIG